MKTEVVVTNVEVVVTNVEALVQKQIFTRILNSDQIIQLPTFLRLPILRDLPARLIALGDIVQSSG